jgi:hypothetical protein
MKDATGELSMTAVAVVAIAAIGVVFTTVLWPAIRTNIMRSTYCSQTIRCTEPDEDGMADCVYCANVAEGADVGEDCDEKTIKCSIKQQSV